MKHKKRMIIVETISNAKTHSMRVEEELESLPEETTTTIENHVNVIQGEYGPEKYFTSIIIFYEVD